jgi:hypothetical protein
MSSLPPPIVASEIRIVDAEGHARLVLSATAGPPSVRLLSPAGETQAALALDAAGRPRLTLSGADAAQPTAAVEIDDKGAHVRFDRPGGGSSYLFLNNAGVSGVVLIDAHNVRRAEVVLAPDGSPLIRRFDAQDHAIP